MQCKSCESHPLIFNGCLTRRCEECQSSRIDRQLKLCKKCSNTLGQCQRCRKKPGADTPAAETPKSGPEATAQAAVVTAPGDPQVMAQKRNGRKTGK